jgi:exopolysaccharide biosynthesis polyprenyl glycosylphosphotransferase
MPSESQADLARLIPGEAPELRITGSKPPASLRSFGPEAVSEIAERHEFFSSRKSFLFLLPQPLQTGAAARCLRSVAADLSLVALNWLLLGALLVPMRRIFPQVWTFSYAAGAPISLLGMALLHGALITLIGYSEGLYAGPHELREQPQILAVSVIWATTVLGAAYWLQGVAWTRSALCLIAGGMHFGVLWASRWHSSLQRRRPEPSCQNVRNVLIVGAGPVGRRVASYLRADRVNGRAVLGFLDDERSREDGVVGQVSELAHVARTGFVDEIILAAPHDRSLLLRVLEQARQLHLDLGIVPELFGCKPAGDIETLGDLPLVCVHAERLPAAALVMKRLLDICAAGLALVLLSPLLVVIAALIKLDSSGCPLYCAQRAGRKGKLFRCYKFRTMVSHADRLKDDLRQDNQRSGPFFKMVDDPRITRVGRFLRRYSLDELPQLWNVLIGDMSLVGPRPHPLDDFAVYATEHLARLDMTPGITGLWQVTARRDPSFQRSMQLDREYIRTWSLKLDFEILLKTILAVLRGEGD